MANLRLASPLQHDSIVDGPGIRLVLWTQGCMHACPGCHNPQTHDINGGILVHNEDIVKEIEDAQLQTGLTLSGGEPFLQSAALLPIVEMAKKKHYSIWAYSGFTFEQIRLDPEKNALLKYLDVLVDGKYVEAKKDYRLVFKGSSNQRIIDVQASLQSEQIVLSNYDDKNQLEAA